MKIHMDAAYGMTTVANIFIDEYMPKANGDYVKVYLYLLRTLQNGTMDLSISSISDCFDYTEGDVIRALRYWEKEQLLFLKKDAQGNIVELYLQTPVSKQINKISDFQPAKEEVSFAPSPVTKPANEFTKFSADAATHAGAPQTTPTQKKKSYVQKEYSPTEIATLMKDDNYDTMCKIIEGYLGHPLSPAELQTATFIYDELGFSADLIYHLYEYCVGRGKYRPQYIAQVAISWAEANVRTPDDAITASISYNADYSAVCKAFGLTRTLGKVELDYIDHWVKQWGFDQRMLVEACNRTLLQINKPDFKYANSILERWHNDKIHTPADIKKQDELHKNKKTANTATTPAKPNTNNKFNQYPQRQYSKEDYFSLEQRLLERSRNS